jgi:glycosyltransferase involved in cell wall biosynthesis
VAEEAANPAAPDAKRRTRRVLIFHGYLLRGTGSNVYNASLAPALARLGHEVHVLCQDRDAREIPWVNRVGRWSSGSLKVIPAESSADASGSAGSAEGPPDATRGSVTVYTPDIGGLLPVYVYDRYEGFETKTFADLSDAELDAYLGANVGAVSDVVRLAGGIDAALANHLVMGPAILARAGIPFAAKIHGSALEFTVRPNPDRFLPYAREGVDAAAGILVGSRHTADVLWGTLPDPELVAKTRLGPPGVDTALFAPRPRSEAVDEVRSFARELAGRGDAGEWGENAADASAALGRWADADGPRVVFLGKLIGSKGLDLLLGAWPLVVSAHPGARLLVVAFGEGASAIASLLAAIEAGDLDRARELAAHGMVTTDAESVPLRMLGSFLADAPGGYADAAQAAAGSVCIAGRLEHDEVARVLPAADALVFPSTFPEAFGMVAAEAAACGVLPVSADHSGAREVSRALGPALPAETRELISFPLGDGAVEAIADRLRRWLATGADVRNRTSDALSDTARELWSWESVAEGVVAASQGRLDELPPVPGDRSP